MTKKEQMEEVQACCCVDVGTFICNQDLTAKANFVYNSEAEAKEALAYFKTNAEAVAKSAECKINSKISETEDKAFVLDAEFTFGCEAEKMIFELKCFR